jgi:hypothetical protein
MFAQVPGVHAEAALAAVYALLLLMIAFGIERLGRLRTPAEACDRCPLKVVCTDSWLESELGRFHRGLSLVLVTLSGLITTIALVRNHADNDVLVLVPVMLLIATVVLRERSGMRVRP